MKRLAKEAGAIATPTSPSAALTLDRVGGSVLPYAQQAKMNSPSIPEPVETMGPETKLYALGLHVSQNNQERFDSIIQLIAEALQLDTVYLVALDRQVVGASESSNRRSSTKVVLQDPKLDSPTSAKSESSSPVSAVPIVSTQKNTSEALKQKQTCQLISYQGPSISSAQDLDADLYRRVLSTAEEGADDIKGLVFQNRSEIGVDEKIGIGTFTSTKKGLWREASCLPGGTAASDGRVFTHQCGIFIAIELESRDLAFKTPAAAPDQAGSPEESSSTQDVKEVEEVPPPKVGFVLSALSSSARRVLGVEDLRYLQSVSSALGALALVCQKDGDAEKEKRKRIQEELRREEELAAKASEASKVAAGQGLRRTISLETTVSVPNFPTLKPPGISIKNRKGLNGKSGKPGPLALAVSGFPFVAALPGTPREETKLSVNFTTSLPPQASLGLGLKSKYQAAMDSYSLAAEQSSDVDSTSTPPINKKENLARTIARKATNATAAATATTMNFKLPNAANPASLMAPLLSSKADKRKNRNSTTNSPTTPDSAPLLSPKSLQPVFSYGYDLPQTIEAQEQAIWRRDMEQVERRSAGANSLSPSSDRRRSSIGGVPSSPLPSPLEFKPMGALYGGVGLKPSPRLRSSQKFSTISTPPLCPNRPPPPRPDQMEVAQTGLSLFESALTPPPQDQDCYFEVDPPISPIWKSAFLSPESSDPSSTVAQAKSIADMESKSQIPPLQKGPELSRPSLRQRRATSSFSVTVVVTDWEAQPALKRVSA